MQTLLPYGLLPDLVTVPEAAKFLGVGRKVIYRLVESGVLPAIRRRGQILLDPCALYRFRQEGAMA